MRTNKLKTLATRRNAFYVLMAITFLGLTAYGVKSVLHLKGNIESQQLELQNKQVELQKLNVELEKEKADKNASKEHIEKLQTDKKKLEAQLQAKAEEKKKIAEAAKKAINIVTLTKTAHAAPQATGSHVDWMNQAGIPASEHEFANYIVTKESGWNPNAVNASSGACGLGQQLPCGKWAGEWNDPVAALKAMNSYVIARYGSWANAHSFWTVNRWY